MDSARRATQIAAHILASAVADHRAPRVHGDDCLAAAGAGAAGGSHHNGLGVTAPAGPAAADAPARSASEAAAHNLGLSAHEKTPLMDSAFSWSEDGAPRRQGLRMVSAEQAAQFDELGFCVVVFWLLMRNTAVTPSGCGFAQREKSETLTADPRSPPPLCAGSVGETARHCPLLALIRPPLSIVNSWLLPAWQCITCTLGPHGCRGQ